MISIDGIEIPEQSDQETVDSWFEKLERRLELDGGKVLASEYMLMYFERDRTVAAFKARGTRRYLRLGANGFFQS